jgi:DNA-binding response OmpR family regulator
MHNIHPAKPTVLIIEDEVDVAHYVQFALEHSGFETIVAHDGLEASNLLPTITPNIILLDMHLPFVDGFTLLNQIKTLPHLQQTKVVLMSGWSDLSSEVENQVDLVLIKPIALSKLRNLQLELKCRHFTPLS